jgi:hypothetical protein
MACEKPKRCARGGPRPAPARLARAEHEECQPTSGHTGQKYPAPVSAQIATRSAITARKEVPRGPRLALEAGIRHSRTWIGFWEDLEAGSEIAG